MIKTQNIQVFAKNVNYWIENHYFARRTQQEIQPRPIWPKIPCPVKISVPRPIIIPIIARRPFQVSAKLTKPNFGREESSDMTTIKSKRLPEDTRNYECRTKLILIIHSEFLSQKTVSYLARTRTIQKRSLNEPSFPIQSKTKRFSEHA